MEFVAYSKDADGFLDGDVKGKLFIEMSTLQPMTGRELAPLVEAKGARLIELPVLGTDFAGQGWQVVRAGRRVRSRTSTANLWRR